MLKAEDVWPLIAKLPHAERVRLARKALVSTVMPEGASDAKRYKAMPVEPDEFIAGDDDLSWDAGGWEDVK